MFQIPESPHWLLARHRTKEALKSLQWLRGWSSPKDVDQEFLALQRYHKQSSGCTSCTKQGIICSHAPSTFVERCSELTRKRVLKPMFIIISISIFAQMAGMASMRPYMVLIFGAYAVPMEANWASVGYHSQT